VNQESLKVLLFSFFYPLSPLTAELVGGNSGDWIMKKMGRKFEKQIQFVASNTLNYLLSLKGNAIIVVPFLKEMFSFELLHCISYSLPCLTTLIPAHQVFVENRPSDTTSPF